MVHVGYGMYGAFEWTQRRQPDLLEEEEDKSARAYTWYGEKAWAPTRREE
jgi:hypothetical protein